MRFIVLLMLFVFSIAVVSIIAWHLPCPINTSNDVGQKGSANQRCIILNSELIDKYNDFDTKKRSRQNFVANGKIISVGIPTKCIYK